MNYKNIKSEQEQIDIRQGTIEFWVRENKLQWNDNNAIVLFNLSTNNKRGSLFMIKDDDNKLKFFYVMLGQGRADTEVDVSGLSLQEPHHIVATWSLKDRKANLYVDGGKLKDEGLLKIN